MEALPPRGSLNWYEHYTDLDTKIRAFDTVVSQLPGLSGKLRDVWKPMRTDPLPAGVLAPATDFRPAGITLSTTEPYWATFENWNFRVSTPWYDVKSLYWMSGAPEPLNPANFDQGCVTRTTGAQNQQNSMVSFTYVGKHVLWAMNAYGPSSVTVWIDGHRVFYGYTAVGVNWLSIPFAEYGSHEIVVSFGLNVPIIAVQLATDRLIRGGHRFTIGLDGDSYADIGQNPDHGGLAEALFETTGCAIVGLGQGSTGWGAQLDSMPSKTVFESPNRATARKAANLDLLLCVGSINSGDKTAAQIRASGRAYLAATPEIPTVLTGPEHFRNGGTALVAQNDALRALQPEFPNYIGFIEWYTQEWQTGAGSTVAPDGLGNQDFIIGPDTVHANRTGNLYFARLFADALGELKYGTLL